MKVKNNILLFICSIISLNFISQNCDCKSYTKDQPVIDSLLDIVDYDGVNKLANKLIKDGTSSCIAFGYGYMAEVLVKQNNSDSAKKCLQITKEYFDNSNCPAKNKYKYFSQSAEFYFYQNNYEEALAHSLKMLEIASDENNYLRLAECNLRIANIFVKMSQPEKAKHYTLLAKQAIDKLPECYKKYHLYNTLANRYNNLY